MDTIKKLGNQAIFQACIQQQHLKEKTGASKREVIPEIEEAKERLKFIDKHFEQFEYQIQDLKKKIPGLTKTTAEFSSEIVEHSSKVGIDTNGYATDIAVFFKAVGDTTEQLVASNKDQKLFIMMKDIRQTIDRLKKLQDERHERRLYTSYLKSKFDDMSKEGKNQQELARIKIELDESKIELEILSSQFLKYVTNLWNIRGQVIDDPMTELVGIIFRTLETAYPELRKLTAKVPAEDLNHDYIPQKQETPQVAPEAA